MCTVSPVDEERDHTTGALGSGIRDLPSQLGTVRTSPPTRAHPTQIEARGVRRPDYTLEIGAFRRPRHQTRLFQLVDLKPPGFRRIWLVRVRAHDFQISVWAQSYQTVPRAQSEMLTSGSHLHTKQSLDVINPAGQIRTGKDQVINCPNGRLHQTRNAPLEQRGREQLLIVSHEQLRPDPDRGRPELPRATEQQGEQLFVGGPGRRQVDVEDLLSFGDSQLCDAVQDSQGGFASNRLPGGALYDTVANPVLRKKLLRAFAALSARSVVPPFELGRHDVLLR